MHTKKNLAVAFLLISFISSTAIASEPVVVKGFSMEMTRSETKSKFEEICTGQLGRRDDIPAKEYRGMTLLTCDKPETSAIVSEKNLQVVILSCGVLNSCSLSLRQWGRFIVDNMPVSELNSGVFSKGGSRLDVVEGKSQAGEWITAFEDGDLMIQRGTYGSSGPSLN